LFGPPRRAAQSGPALFLSSAPFAGNRQVEATNGTRKFRGAADNAGFQNTHAARCKTANRNASSLVSETSDELMGSDGDDAIHMSTARLVRRE
jgi:hypothetical protein